MVIVTTVSCSRRVLYVGSVKSGEMVIGPRVPGDASRQQLPPARMVAVWPSAPSVAPTQRVGNAPPRSLPARESGCRSELGGCRE